MAEVLPDGVGEDDRLPTGAVAAVDDVVADHGAVGAGQALAGALLSPDSSASSSSGLRQGHPPLRLLMLLLLLQTGLLATAHLRRGDLPQPRHLLPAAKHCCHYPKS